MIAYLDPNKVIDDATLTEIFNMFDRDSSNTITGANLKKVLGQGLKFGEIDDTEWERMVDEVDKSGNGEISFLDFKDMMFELFSIKPNN
jgi:Ca2+-binding EF-hand superfamily protein